MTTDSKIFERIKDNPPGKRGIRRTEIWDREVTAPLPPGWIHTDRPGDKTVVVAEVCKGITKSWWESARMDSWSSTCESHVGHCGA